MCMNGSKSINGSKSADKTAAAAFYMLLLHTKTVDENWKMVQKTEKLCSDAAHSRVVSMLV